MKIDNREISDGVFFKRKDGPMVVLLQDTCAFSNRFTKGFIDSKLRNNSDSFLSSKVLTSQVFDDIRYFLLKKVANSGLLVLSNGHEISVSKTRVKKLKKSVWLLLGMFDSETQLNYIVVQFISPKIFRRDITFRKQFSLIAGTKNLRFLVLKEKNHDYSMHSVFPYSLIDE